MSHRQIGQNLVGELGELSVINKFDEFELVKPLYSLHGFEKVPFFHTNLEYENFFDEWDEKLMDVYGTFTFPDYFIMDTKIFIEVKTGKYAKLEKNQIEEFPKILDKGFRIFIIRPKLSIENDAVEVVDFSCDEFLGRNKRIRITLDVLKRLIEIEIRERKGGC